VNDDRFEPEFGRVCSRTRWTVWKWKHSGINMRGLSFAMHSPSTRLALFYNVSVRY